MEFNIPKKFKVGGVDMEERELAIWKGIRDALCEPIQNKRLWKPECETCSRYDHIEGRGI